MATSTEQVEALQTAQANGHIQARGAWTAREDRVVREATAEHLALWQTMVWEFGRVRDAAFTHHDGEHLARAEILSFARLSALQARWDLDAAVWAESGLDKVYRESAASWSAEQREHHERAIVAAQVRSDRCKDVLGWAEGKRDTWERIVDKAA